MKFRVIRVVRNEFPIPFDYIDDCEHIRDAFKAEGYFCSLETAYELWNLESASMCASWLTVPKSYDVVVFRLRNLFEETGDVIGENDG